MNILISDWIHTSNDLLRRLMAKHASAAPKHQIVSQSAEDVQDIENASAVGMALSRPGGGVS
jgi:hypothetical protein